MRIRLFLILFFCSSGVFAQQYTIDANKSTVRWYGYYLFSFGEHYGTIAVKDGTASIMNGTLASGNVKLDMASITPLDMPADDGGNMLGEHLKSADFFDVAKFPEAQFEIISVKPIKDASPDGPNVEVTGNLTLKGSKNALTFPATVNSNEQLVIKAKFKFDRTKWNVRYNSGKYFSEAGDSAISDAIGIEMNITATKTSTK
jgi:polyisoprenoid-binding protein YceI